MTVVAATHMLITQCVQYDNQRECTIDKLFQLARKVPSFRITYNDPERAVSQIIDAVG